MKLTAGSKSTKIRYYYILSSWVFVCFLSWQLCESHQCFQLNPHMLAMPLMLYWFDYICKYANYILGSKVHCKKTNSNRSSTLARKGNTFVIVREHAVHLQRNKKKVSIHAVF